MDIFRRVSLQASEFRNSAGIQGTVVGDSSGTVYLIIYEIVKVLLVLNK